MTSARSSPVTSFGPFLANTTYATGTSPYPGIRYANDGRLFDRGISDENSFYLGRIDIESATDDHVLLPIKQVEKSVIVDTADVACAEPMSADLGNIVIRPIHPRRIVGVDGNFADLPVATGSSASFNMQSTSAS